MAEEATSTKEESKWDETELLNLNTWIYCICLVDFDLTEGQVTKFCYPFDILSNEEKTNIANLSFPDSHTTNKDSIDTQFVFRFRARMLKQKKANKLRGKRRISYNHRHRSHPYLFGYVHFKQKPDKSIDRGYFQKALVIITPIPYIHIFIKALSLNLPTSDDHMTSLKIAKSRILSVEIIGGLYFEYDANSGQKVLESACQNICSWPAPSIDGEVGLPLLGNIIRVVLSPKCVPPSASILLPKTHKLFKQSKKNHNHKKEDKNNDHHSINGYQLVDKHSTHSSGGCFQEVNIYKYFHVVLGNLWFLWELALTGQPLLVIGSSAKQCSHSVLGIMSLISPITYHGDFRPYFTIYDDDFKHFCNLHDRNMLPPLILGVTSPFFLKVMPKFPHILILSDDEQQNKTSNSLISISSKEEISPNNNNSNNDDKFIVINKEKKNIKEDKMTIHVKTTNTDNHQASVKRTSQKIWGTQKEVDVTSSHNTIISKSTPCLAPDEQVLSRLLTVSNVTTSSGIELNKNELEIEQVCILNNATLRKYFQHLTEKFLEPFQEYFTFKVPSGLWNPYLNPPHLKTFEKDNFLNIIKEIPKSFLNDIPLRMSSLPTGKRSTLVKLYTKFLKSPHFPSWFNKKRERAKRKCDKIIRQMIRKIKFERMVEGKPVREGIEMYQCIHRLMNNNNQSIKPKADLNDVLIRHRAVLRSALPSQIIEALDQQVEKMRTEQIKKRKEWQIKYQQHLKQQRAVYNLDNNEAEDDDEDEDNTEEIVESMNGNLLNESPLSSQTKISEISEKTDSLKSIGRSKSESHEHNNGNGQHKFLRQKSPNQMLSSPPPLDVKSHSEKSLVLLI